MNYYQRSLKIRLETYGENHVDVADSYNNLGIIFNNFALNSSSINYKFV